MHAGKGGMGHVTVLQVFAKLITYTLLISDHMSVLQITVRFRGGGRKYNICCVFHIIYRLM